MQHQTETLCAERRASAVAATNPQHGSPALRVLAWASVAPNVAPCWMPRWWWWMRVGESRRACLETTDLDQVGFEPMAPGARDMSDV